MQRFISLKAAPVLRTVAAGTKEKPHRSDAPVTRGARCAGRAASALWAGVFATRAATGSAEALGWVYGNPAQVANQLTGAAMASVFAIAGSYILLKITDLTAGLRAGSDHEQQGLDPSMHGEEGYSFES